MGEERVGLVLAGGGARGAYEVGALSVLLPALEAAGQRPSVLVGTSVGAINIAYFAANAHLGTCLLYTSDAADEEDSVDLGGRRIIKKKNKNKINAKIP